jgi:hypothetical protein
MAIKIPKDFEVQPLRADQRVEARTTCGTCGLSWDDDRPTSYTPAPSGRCPFEAFHDDEDARQRADAERDVRAFVEHVEKTHDAKFDPLAWEILRCVVCRQESPCDAVIAVTALRSMLEARPSLQTLVRVQSQLEDFDWENRAQ